MLDLINNCWRYWGLKRRFPFQNYRVFLGTGVWIKLPVLLSSKSVVLAQLYRQSAYTLGRIAPLGLVNGLIFQKKNPNHFIQRTHFYVRQFHFSLFLYSPLMLLDNTDYWVKYWHFYFTFQTFSMHGTLSSVGSGAQNNIVFCIFQVP